MDNRTFGERAADKIASFGGSWAFIGLFTFVLIAWVFFNSIVLFRREWFDPAPFLLMNIILSCLAALQAPIIMMSQNRQDSRDREQAAAHKAMTEHVERMAAHIEKLVERLAGE